MREVPMCECAGGSGQTMIWCNDFGVGSSRAGARSAAVAVKAPRGRGPLVARVHKITTKQPMSASHQLAAGPKLGSTS
jgi:hypothetical protein